MRRVLFVGMRTEALHAAERLGLEVVALVDKPLLVSQRKSVARSLPYAREMGFSKWRALAGEIKKEGPVDAVLALTESAVLPAARMRRALRLSGASVRVAWRCHDKLAMKRVALREGFRCARTRLLNADEGRLCTLPRELGFPMVIKQRRSSGSRGLQVVQDEPALFTHAKRGWLAEAFIDGIEMSVELFVSGGRVLFENATEYLSPLWANVLPARLTPQEEAQVSAFAHKVMRAFHVERGIVHLELFRTAEGLVLGELAVRPPGGCLMELIGLAYGIDAWETWIRCELGEEPRLQVKDRRAAGVWFLHPGPGVLERVEGLHAARSVQGILEVSCRAREGRAISVREGSGQSVGRIVALGANADAVARSLEDAHAQIRFFLR